MRALEHDVERYLVGNLHAFVKLEIDSKKPQNDLQRGEVMLNPTKKVLNVVVCVIASATALLAFEPARAESKPIFLAQSRVAGAARSPGQWGSVGSTTVQDGASANRGLNISGQNALVLSDFGFSIPSGATVTAVRLKHFVSKEEGDCPDDLAANITLNAGSSGYPASYGNVIANLNGGCGTYIDEGPATFSWSVSQPIPTASQVNSSGFGVVIAAPLNPVTAHYVDYVELEVEYTQ